MLARALRIFFVQILKKIAMQLFRKENFLSFPSFKNWKKSSSGHAECSFDPPAKNILSVIWTLLLEIGKRRKNDKLSKKTSSSNCSSEHAQRNFGKPAVTLSARIQKTIAKTKRDEYFFEQNCFIFIKNDSLATENAILTTLARTFL